MLCFIQFITIVALKDHITQLKNSMPFAVSSSIEIHEVKGAKVRGRQYPWGIVETENPEHSDFVKLRSLLVSHMQDLREGLFIHLFWVCCKKN